MALPDHPSWRNQYRIGIVGGGLVGLATGILLRRGGFAVTVLEKETELRPLGTGLQLPATCNKVLQELGILEDVAAHAVFPHSIVLHKYDSGHELHVMNLMPHVLDTYGAPHLVAHRADLRQSLANRFQNFGGTLELGVSIDFENSNLAGGVMKFDNGNERAYELIIGADGDSSRCRDLVLGRKEERKPSGWISNRVVIDEKLAMGDPELKPLYDPPTIRCWLGPSCAAITYLMDGKINIVFNSRLGKTTPFFGPRSVEAGEMRRLVPGWEPRIRKMMEFGTGFLKWVSFEAAPIRQWVHPDGRLVLVGDSAHPILQFLAHGAAMGMESASVLGNLLNLSTNAAQVPDLFRLYNRLRFPRTEIVREASKKLARLWHMPNGPMCDERDRELKYETPSIGFPNLLADPCFQSWLWSYDPKEEATAAFTEYRCRQMVNE